MRFSSRNAGEHKLAEIDRWSTRECKTGGCNHESGRDVLVLFMPGARRRDNVVAEGGIGKLARCLTPAVRSRYSGKENNPQENDPPPLPPPPHLYHHKEALVDKQIN